MRKILLAATLLLGTVATEAQTWTGAASWNKTLTTTDGAKTLASPRTAVDKDGNVYLASTYNKAFTFGGKDFAVEDGLTSAFLAKYDKEGKEQWVATIMGNATISGLNTDANGNVYIAGSMCDLVIYTGADGKEAEAGKEGETSIIYGFVAKLDADGKFQAFRTIVPVANATAVESGLYSLESSDIRFIPNKLMVSGDKVYVSALSTGDVVFDNGSWTGSYLNVFDFMYMDVPSLGVMSLSASDLTGTQAVANIQATNNFSSVQQNPESLSFTVDNGVVYLCFVGKGDETLTTVNGAEKLRMSYAEDESGNMEHAFVLASVGGTANTKILHVAQHSEIYGTDQVNNVMMENGSLYITGTYYNQLGFATDKKSTGSADIFAACVDPATFDAKWAATSAFDEGEVTKFQEIATASSVRNGKVFVAGFNQSKDAGSPLVAPLAFNAENGTMTAADASWIKAIADNGNNVAVAGDKDGVLSLSFYAMIPSGISAPNAVNNDANAPVYSLGGMRYDSKASLPKGIYIKAGKKIVVK